MKLAIIKDGPFLPVKDGASYKIYNMALEYQRNGIAVYFILINRGWVTDKAILDSGIDNFFCINPESAYNSSKLTQLLYELEIDCIQTNIPELIMNKADEWSDFEIIFDSHDVLYEQSEQKGKSEEAINTEKFLDYVAGTLSSAVFCCSERDKSLYVQLGLNPEKIKVVKNGTRLQKSCQKHEKKVAFIGHMYYEPNYQAVLQLFTFANQTPEIQYLVIGNYPDKLIERKPQNVKMLGYVKDFIPILEKCSVAIAPITCGSGSRVKILDYLSANLRVISTTIGAAGLEDLHNLICLEDNFDYYPNLIRDLMNRVDEPNFSGALYSYDFTNIGNFTSAFLKSFAAKKCIGTNIPLGVNRNQVTKEIVYEKF